MNRAARDAIVAKLLAAYTRAKQDERKARASGDYHEAARLVVKAARSLFTARHKDPRREAAAWKTFRE